ncbi:trypsin-like serine protease [Photobacterium damselae]|uniref:trypsin-like serine protease n=1 Tax=Photobacterium damselae TaxID=38293 RepID=UPI000D977949|nr:trypsin-like serine protease [Photobacterium damselae]NVO72532.1 trypsin-like serine protease [Photobacterium damselae subsp. damselae]SPY25294.1 Trypsin precursor [Photobacterium damselae]
MKRSNYSFISQTLFQFALFGLIFFSSTVFALVTPKIVGGSSGASLPWQAYLKINSQGQTYTCGAVVIGSHTLLTAAHCLEFNDKIVTPSQVSVWTGITQTSQASYSSSLPVKRIDLHPLFDSDTFINDIAVISLVDEVTSNAIPITLTQPDEQQEMDTQFALTWVTNGRREGNLLVSGWGSTDPTLNDTSGSSQLLATVLSGVPDSICRSLWGGFISLDESTQFLCAAATAPWKDQDSCLGDSGGPLIWQDPQHSRDSDYGLRLAGIVSFGDGCDGKRPGGYTEVSHYYSWIASHMDEELQLSNQAVFTENPFTRYDEDGDLLDEFQGALDDTQDGLQQLEDNIDKYTSGGSLSWLSLLGVMFLAWRRR